MNENENTDIPMPRVTGHFDMTEKEKQEASETLHEILREIGILKDID